MKKIREFFVILIATGLGTGFAPVASGTFGTLVGIAIVFLARNFSFANFLALGIGIFFVGWWATREWSQKVQEQDSRTVVIDEVLGYMVAMGAFPRTAFTLIVQFFLFRLFDVLKPPPIRQLDRWGKGLPIGWKQSFAVIVDDLLAGLLAWAVFWLMSKFFALHDIFDLSSFV